MRLEYEDGNRCFEVVDNGEDFTYIAPDPATALAAHATAIKQMLGDTVESEPRVREVSPAKDLAIRFDNLEDALRKLGPTFIQVPDFVRDTGSIVLKMPACTWAKTIAFGATEQIGSSVF